MEMFAALVTGQRAASVPAPAPAAKGKGKGKGKTVEEENAAYLSIQLEEIVIVKNDDVARGRGSTLTSGYSPCTSMGQRVAAAAAPPSSGMSAAAAAAARGALSTTAGWIVGSDELRSTRIFA